MAIQWIGSPNKDKGREGYRPEAIVIHIMEGTLKGTDAWFSNEESGSDALYKASAGLIETICRRWAIPCDRDHIIGHREIRADKTCPGLEVDLDKLVDMANDIHQSPATFNFVKKPGIVQTRVDLNIREKAPTSAAPLVRTIKGGRKLPYQGWTSNGLTVNGNAHRYKDADGNYFWAGATAQPIPGL